MHFQLHNSDLSEELLGIKSHHTKQYSAGFPLRIIFWLKMPPPLMFFVVPTRWKNLEDGGGGAPNSQKFTHFLHQKFLSNPLCKLHLYLQSFLLYHCSAFMYTHHNFSMTLNGQNSLNWNLHYSYLLMQFGKPSSLSVSFSIFPTPFFILSFIKLHLTLLQLWFCVLLANQM